MQLRTKISITSLSLLINLIFLLLLCLFRSSNDISFSHLQPVEIMFESDNTPMVQLPSTQKGQSPNIPSPAQQVLHQPQRAIREQENFVATQRQGTPGAQIDGENIEHLNISTDYDTEQKDASPDAQEQSDEQHSFSEKDAISEVAPQESQPPLEHINPSEELTQYVSLPKSTLHEPIQIRRSLRRAQPEQIPQKKQITLSELAYGFLHGKRPQTIAQEQSIQGGSSLSGMGPVNVLSSYHGKMTQRQARIMRYIRKIEEAFWREFARHQYDPHAVLIRRSIEPGSAHVLLQMVIGRAGVLEKVAIIRSSGHVIVDNFIVFLIQEAATAFPPFPDTIEDERLDYNYLIDC